MTPEELKDRTRKFGLAIIKLSMQIPKSRVADIMYRQLLRAGTSVGANYRCVQGPFTSGLHFKNWNSRRRIR